jgi:hypothetical protein
VGLIKELVLAPLAPLRFTGWVAEQIADEADREQFSAGAGVQQLEELERARERGEISEEEAAEREGEIIEGQMSRPASEEESERG